MKKVLAIILGGWALTLGAASRALADDDSYPPVNDATAMRSAYSYVRATSGEVTVLSAENGQVKAGRNLPISTGDEISVSEDGRAEIALADGNLLEIGGGTHTRFESLASQQGDDDSVSAIRLSEGSVILSAAGGGAIPRIDTDETTVYLGEGARVRVNANPRRGTEIIVRTGSVEVKTPQGSSRLRAGQYMVARPEREPEIEAGIFSHDRFDMWAEERLGTLADSRSASARYVDNDYSSDVASMDGYGDWNYSSESDAQVWSPRVDAGWTPYSSGSWYYTPAGLTWWSSDPWGWVPFHYGSWFFSSSWNRWCWRPASVYSPAWVYWGFSNNFVGWCPIGFYSFWSPWFDGYFRHAGWWGRPGVSIALNGRFSTRTIDFRGWNFVGSRGFATAARRMDVISGARIRERLGVDSLAISSRPIVVSPRGGAVHEAIQTFVREAPRNIERTAPADSSRMAPILAHQRTLPPETVAAVEQRAVVAEHGRLAGPGVADVAPRGALVDRNRSLSEIAARVPAADRSPARTNSPAFSNRTADIPRSARPDTGRAAADWRTPNKEFPARSIESRDAQSLRETRPQGVREARPDLRSNARTRSYEAAPQGDWRSRPRVDSAHPAETSRRETWRSPQDLPPARRVIEGAVPGRRTPDGPPEETFRRRVVREAPAPSREFRAEPRPEFRTAPPPRVDRAPAPHIDRAPAPPPPRVERAPAPAPSRESHSSVSHPQRDRRQN